MTGGAPNAGQMVLVRRRPAVVRDVIAHGNGSPVVHLAEVEYIDGWRHPERESVIWEREVGARVLSSISLPRIEAPESRPDRPDLFDAFVDAVRWSSVTSVPLLGAWQSAIQVEDYQLYPVLKALLLPRVTMLLADDVGLGKTIEAGLILSELIARRRVRRILVVCPASLQTQWRDELLEKFSLEFTVLDRDETFRIQRELGMDANPWSVSPRVITSMDYLRQPDVRRAFVDSSRRLAHVTGATLPWDVLVVDEAHNLMPSSFGDDSERTAMLREIAPLFEHRLFLTATPHNGYTLSFTGLLELLDPVRFSQDTEISGPARGHLQTVMVRRLKSELNGGRDRFARREVKALPISLATAEKASFEALRAYREEGLRLVGARGRRERTVGRFVFSLLAKRLLSSSYAFARTWWEHVEGFTLPEGSLELADLARARAEEPLNDDAEKEQREADAARQGAAWLRLFGEELLSARDGVSRALEDVGWNVARMREPFTRTAALPMDGKWDALARWVDTFLRDGRDFRPDERAIVFTEYRDTLAYLMWRFQRAGLVRPVWQELYGGAARADRDRVKDAFNDPGAPLRLLLATDIASEGLNLQTACRYVVHQEIPWNPMRLEQRNGRVDRHNQPRDVGAFHFHSDEDADIRFLSRVAEKVHQVREDLGSVGQVIDQAVLEHFASAPVTPEELDRRVQSALAASPVGEDLAGRDDGGEDAYTRAMTTFRATEARLGLSAVTLARLLREATALDGGRLADAGGDRTARFTQVPPAWEAVVDESLRVTKGDVRRALPKLAFATDVLETVEHGRRIFRPRPDTVLLRLAHPVVRRAIGGLRRRMWEEAADGPSRWTVRSAALPRGLRRVAVLHVLLQVINALREVHHADVLPLVFDASTERLTLLRDDDVAVLGPPMTLVPPALCEAEMDVRRLWPEHREQLRHALDVRRHEFVDDHTARLRQELAAEIERERERFRERRRELARQRLPRTLERLRREAEAAERSLALSPFLFQEMQEAEERRVREMQWEIHRTHLAQLEELLDREESRVLERLLPGRHTLADLHLYPVAVEYRIPAP